jgi:replicative DNA helicase
MIAALFSFRHGEEGCLVLPLTDEAVEVFKGFYEDIEKRLSECGDLYFIASWAGKFRGQIARVAALLELASWAERDVSGGTHKDDYPVKISKQSIESAIKIGHYLIPHAKAAFHQLNINKDMRIAKKVASWIITKCFTDNAEHEVSQRDIFERLKGLGDVNKVKDIEPALEILRQHGYIRLKQQNREGKKGRHSVVYEVNTLLDPCFS